MTESHEPAPATDAPLDPSEVAVLRERLAVPDADEAVRARHLATAMDAFDAASGTGRVIPLRRTRRGGAALPWAAAAAVALVVAVVGIQVAGNNASRQDSAGDAVTAAPESAADPAGAGAAPTDDGIAADRSAEPSPTVPADGLDAAASVIAPPVDLGELPDDTGLRDAAAAARDRGAATTSAPAAPGDTAAEEFAEEAGDVATRALTACDAAIAALGSPRFTATVDGRPVIAAFADGDGGGALVIVALDDCTVRSR